MLTAYVRHADGTFEELDSLIEVARILRDPGAHVWLDMAAPDEWSLMLLGEAFSFHPLAIEDCLHAEQRARIDPYEGYIFMVMYGPLLNDEGELIGVRELAIFCSPQFIVTIHHQPITAVAAIKERCRRDPENLLGRGMDHLLHTIVDGVIDGYQLPLDRLEDEVNQIEDLALSEPDAELLERISNIKRELFQIYRHLMPLRESLGQLARGEYPFIGRNVRPYFRDVLDHLLRITEQVSLYREQVNSARDLYMSSLSQRTNETMKTLTIWATIMLPLTLISGIYGMNFEHLWPPSDHPYGFWAVVGAMVALGSAMLWYFRRRGWIE